MFGPHHRRGAVGLVITGALLIASTPTFAQVLDADSGSATTSSTATTSTASVPAAPAKPTVVRKIVHKPKKVRTFRHRWVVPATPTYAQVKELIALEAKRWNISAARLSCRIRGESTYRWNAQNGQYVGLLQFGSNAFQRGIASIGSHVFTKTRIEHGRAWVRVTRVYSDGSRRTTRSHRIKIVRIHQFRGVLPRSVPRHHGAAQIRMGARAMAGLGAVHDREWEVRC